MDAPAAVVVTSGPLTWGPLGVVFFVLLALVFVALGFYLTMVWINVSDERRARRELEKP